MDGGEEEDTRLRDDWFVVRVLETPGMVIDNKKSEIRISRVVNWGVGCLQNHIA